VNGRRAAIVRRVARIAGVATAAVLAAVAVYVLLSLPPRSVILPSALPPTIVYGAYHVHSSRSDGSGTVDEIAAAAARAGLAFVILTDHGDAARRPDPPAYHHGVLCFDATEITTSAGHIVALGLTRAADYPLGGEARDVIEDIHRLGGVAIAAHPDSPRPELRWRGGGAGLDGVEWLNADSEWRDEPGGRLLMAAARSLLRPAGVIASLFERPARSLARWDAAARNRPVFSLVALDAHARIAWGDDGEPRRSGGLAFPSYDAMVRTAAQAVVLERPLSRDPADDAARILAAVTSGRTYTIVRAAADPAALDFHAAMGASTVPMGGTIEDGFAGVTLRAGVPGVPDADLALMRDGQRVAAGKGSLEFAPTAPGVYRVEAYYPRFAVPWLLSNAIRLGLSAATPPSEPPTPPAPVKAILVTSGPWTTEQDRSSTASLEAEGPDVRFRFQLGGGPLAGQFAALVTTGAGDAALDRIRFSARADRPMRVSVQVRVLGGGPDGRRWRRSVYVDRGPRLVDIALADLEPVGPATTLRPVVARVQAVLFVIDTVNAAAGATGSIWLSGVTLGLGDAGGG
jgi:hypothetical protein